MIKKINNEYISTLDSIVSSTNAVQEFIEEYENNMQFREWIKKGIPGIESCYKCNQDNPWHIYDILNHILHSVEAMNEMTKGLDIPSNDKRLLSYSMLFHDVGKPACKVKRYKKKYGREVDTFYGHNLKSVELFKQSDIRRYFNEEECKVIEKLVCSHDAFINITNNPDEASNGKKLLNEDLLNQLAVSLDSDGTKESQMKMLQYLIYVSKSDNLAQNPNLAKDAIKVLEDAQKIIKSINKNK